MAGLDNILAGACRQIADDGGLNVDFSLHAFSLIWETAEIVVCPLLPWVMPLRVVQCELTRLHTTKNGVRFLHELSDST